MEYLSRNNASVVSYRLERRLVPLSQSRAVPGVLFDGTGQRYPSVQYGEFKSVERDFSVEFYFRTFLSSGTLLSGKNGDKYLLVRISNGAVIFEFQNTNKQGNFAQATVIHEVSDGQWHKLKAEKNGASVTLAIDESVNVTTARNLSGWYSLYWLQCGVYIEVSITDSICWLFAWLERSQWR
eukprot:m.311943 g.311943  ORF g.311943 m.311943 type:complete len:182 (+) comp180155_c0_seq1:248-793(+)